MLSNQWNGWMPEVKDVCGVLMRSCVASWVVSCWIICLWCIASGALLVMRVNIGVKLWINWSRLHKELLYKISFTPTFSFLYTLWKQVLWLCHGVHFAEMGGIQKSIQLRLAQHCACYGWECCCEAGIRVTALSWSWVMLTLTLLNLLSIDISGYHGWHQGNHNLLLDVALLVRYFARRLMLLL